MIENYINYFYLDERRLDDRDQNKIETNELKLDRLHYWKRLLGKEERFFEESIRTVSGIDKKDLLFLSENKSHPTEKAQEEEWIFFLEKLRTGKYDQIQIPFFQSIHVPFTPFFKPFLQMGLAETKKRLGSLWNLDDKIIHSLIINLAQILFETSNRTLILELNIARVSGLLKGETPEERFQYFSHVLLKDKKFISYLHHEYPVLIRLLITKTIYWSKHIAEMIERLERDRSIITNEFHKGEPIGELQQIHLGLGDPHNKGKGVVMLQFDSGLKIIYKPRPLEIEIQFQKLLHWLNNHRPTKEPFYIMKVVNKEKYGWVEFIEYKGCNSVDEIEHFYNKIGQQLALLYVLNAVDFHYENLIAHHKHPVLIDLESLFHQSIAESQLGETAIERAEAMLQRSVQSTGFLPRPLFYHEDPKAGAADVSGLGATDEQRAPIKIPTITQDNTDQMKIVQDYGWINAKSNRPLLKETEIDVSNYLKDLESGFREMYIWIMENKELFRKQLDHFKGIEIRSIARSTMFYRSLLQQSYHPDFLRDGLDRDLLFHRLWLETEYRPDLQKIIRSEKKDLLTGDIPYFSTRTDQVHLWDSNGDCIRDCFELTALEKVYNKIELLSSKDCEEQLHVLRMSMLANHANHYADVAPITPLADHKNIHESSDEYLKEAERIGEYLLSRAISGINDGEEDLSWISTILESNNEISWNISPVGFDLYNGNSGIALFLGYLSSLTGRQDFAKAAYKAMIPVRKELQQFANNPEWSVGVFSGAGGYLYTMSHLISLWEDEGMKDELLSALPGFVNMISHDNIYDYIGGSAGAISLLLRIYKQTGSELALEGAKLCADHLLANASPAKEGIGWIHPWDTKPLTGFSHGTSGIAATLMQLYEITKESKLVEAVTKALQFERSYFDPEAGNWSTPGRDGFSVAWCHGAPGILLSRLMLKHFGYEDSQIDEEIEIALQTTIKYGFGNNRTLCHGDFGQIDILLFASEVLQNKNWSHIASSAAQQVLQIIKENGFQKGSSGGVESVGLMAGLSGYGFGLLKLHAPSKVPSVLKLD